MGSYLGCQGGGGWFMFTQTLFRDPFTDAAATLGVSAYVQGKDTPGGKRAQHWGKAALKTPIGAVAEEPRQFPLWRWGNSPGKGEVLCTRTIQSQVQPSAVAYE